MIFDRLLGRRRRDGIPRAIYAAIVAQARQPGLYSALGVPDTLEGRFEMVVLHTILVLRRLRREQGPVSGLAEDICTVMFTDFDHNLREIGVGDLAVGKKVRKLAEAFYGRGKALDQALAASDQRAMVAAFLARNLAADGVQAGNRFADLANYVIALDEALDSASLDDLMNARLPVVDPAPQGETRSAPLTSPRLATL
ncbi:ubiquinol-cytochrome C chaperone family protein [Rhodoligotrophos defluvii]|uniref:ubiquinol-cytochrome C chaperone family protein n=1 Tax=Rhodoligotrophos defluvii TaxID=2561934 RepID=UPI0010C9E4F8|nr:ubiquinol-cytochrome C chaperone family protein [Rhodoligotrophos defluvii]